MNCPPDSATKHTQMKKKKKLVEYTGNLIYCLILGNKMIKASCRQCFIDKCVEWP